MRTQTARVFVFFFLPLEFNVCMYGCFSTYHHYWVKFLTHNLVPVSQYLCLSFSISLIYSLTYSRSIQFRPFIRVLGGISIYNIVICYAFTVSTTYNLYTFSLVRCFRAEKKRFTWKKRWRKELRNECWQKCSRAMPNTCNTIYRLAPINVYSCYVVFVLPELIFKISNESKIWSKVEDTTPTL